MNIRVLIFYTVNQKRPFIPRWVMVQIESTENASINSTKSTLHNNSYYIIYKN